MMDFVPTEHPVLPIPTAEQALAMGEKAWLELMARREEIIRQEKEDPIRYQFEPPIWKLCDLVMGMPWTNKDEAAEARDRLGLKQTVKVLLIQGGNRASKTRYAARCAMKRLLGAEEKDEAIAWIYHTNNENSVEQHQSLMWEMLPAELKRTVRSQVTYISYTQKYGFSDNKFVLPNKAMCSFRNYEQDIGTAEGGNITFIWADEKVLPEWVEAFRLRIATKDGRVVCTFTPVWGFSSTVKMFVDGSRSLRESTAFLLPADEGPADEAAALRMEDCLEWVKKDDLTHLPALARGAREQAGSRKAAKEDRRFKRVPRLLQCFRQEEAVVYFHVSDNPFAPPANVLEKVRGATADYVRERWYGVANKVQASRFPLFDVNVHMVKRGQIPTIGTNYQITDPCGARNFATGWFRKLPRAIYMYREWPGNYEIPGVGVPEPWAVPDGKKPDGKKGKGQEPFGFGLLDYKREWARLEKWKDWERFGMESLAQSRQVAKGEDLKSETAEDERILTLAEWREEHGSEEKVRERYLDSRFASTPRPEQDRPVTLLEEFDEIGIFCVPTPGDVMTDGLQRINDLLAYDRRKPIDYLNAPGLYISEDCVNTIFALQTWTGEDGAKGATKDWIDILRYMALLELDYMEDEEKAEGGRRNEEDGEKKKYY